MSDYIEESLEKLRKGSYDAEFDRNREALVMWNHERLVACTFNDADEWVEITDDETLDKLKRQYAPDLIKPETIQ